MDDTTDNTTANAPSETPPADIPEAPPETGQAQQETPAGGEEAKQAESPPESYVLDLGEFAANLPPEEAEFLTSLAKESGATAEAASALLQRMGLYHQTVQEYQSKEWAEASRNDPEFGGVHLEQNLGIAKQAMEQFCPPALQEMLGRSGMGNHPDVIRMFLNIGKAMSEDKVVTGAPAAGDGFDARDFYPNSNMNP